MKWLEDYVLVKKLRLGWWHNGEPQRLELWQPMYDNTINKTGFYRLREMPKSSKINACLETRGIV